MAALAYDERGSGDAVSIIEVEYGDLSGVRGEDSRDLMGDAAVRARRDPEFRARCELLLLDDRRARWGFALVGLLEERRGRGVPRWPGGDVLTELVRRRLAAGKSGVEFPGRPIRWRAPRPPGPGKEGW